MNTLWQILVNNLIVGILIFFFRNFLSTFITQSIKHKYDHKLEELKANLNNQQTTITSLQNDALANMSKRKLFFYRQQIKAVQDLWMCVIDLKYGRTAVETIKMFNIDIAAKQSQESSTKQQMFKELSGNIDIEYLKEQNNKIHQANTLRPFIPTTIWAYFRAYQEIVHYAVAQLVMLQYGTPQKFLNAAPLITLIKNVFPTADTLTLNSCLYYFDTLEDKLLEEIKKLLNGEGVDKKNIEDAAGIIKTAQNLNNDIQKQSEQEITKEKHKHARRESNPQPTD